MEEYEMNMQEEVLKETFIPLTGESFWKKFTLWIIILFCYFHIIWLKDMLSSHGMSKKWYYCHMILPCLFASSLMTSKIGYIKSWCKQKLITKVRVYTFKKLGNAP